MLLPRIFIIVFIIMRVSRSGAEEETVTHVPNLKAVKLAPEIIEALKNKPVSNEECRSQTLQKLQKYFEGVNEFAYQHPKPWREPSSHISLPAGMKLGPVPPCGLCSYVYSNATIELPTYNIHPYMKGRLIIQAVVLFNPKVHIMCRQCKLSDDNGKSYYGQIAFEWTNTAVKVVYDSVDSLAFRIANGYFLDPTVLLVEPINDFGGTIHGTCNGDENFERLCHKLHATKELDHCMHNAVELLFHHEKYAEMIRQGYGCFTKKCLSAGSPTHLFFCLLP